MISISVVSRSSQNSGLVAPKYKFNQTVVKLFGYGDFKKFKISNLKSLRTSGIEDEDKEKPIRGTVNDSKLEESLIRSKNAVFEYAYCNPWEFFFTATLDENKVIKDRSDLNAFENQMRNFFKYMKKKYNLPDLKFLLIPERHKDQKNWHMHGLIHGLPVELLHQFKIGDVMGATLAEKVKNGDVVYNWLDYYKKFGFCDLEPIKNHEAVSKYITKYITKNMESGVTELNKNTYFHSQGLKKAPIVKKGTSLVDFDYSFENEYCRVAWLEYSEKNEEMLKQVIV